MTPVPADAARGVFARHALREAQRYGPDRWVFVRELVQNARDAGASRVDLHTETGCDRARAVCRDDGEGMTLEHAQAYLFTLYASSKEECTDQAGQFGVGFWSVLRFAPDRITIRSRPGSAAAWEVELSHDLSVVRYGPAELEGGTEVVLERDGQDGDLAEQVMAAARRDVALVTCRDHPDRPLEVWVNGHPVHQGALELPSPSATFRARGARGAVGFGSEPRIELLCRGFRVRTARSFDELLSERREQRQPAAHRERPGSSLAPVVLLDSPDLDVVLARSDVREDAALEALVERAQDELRRLLSRQLDRGYALTLSERLARVCRSPAVRWLALALLAVALGWGVGRALQGFGAGGPPERTHSVGPSGASAGVEDLGDRYRGAVVDLPSTGDTLRYPVTYRPVELDLLLAHAVVDPGAASTRLQVEQLGSCPARRHVPGPEVVMDVVLAGSTGPVRLPVPTGYAVVPESVRLDGRAVEVRCTEHGEPVVQRTGSDRLLTCRYVTRPAVAETVGAFQASPEAVPAAVARQLRGAGPEEVVQTVVDWVVAHVRYERSQAVAEEHRRMAAAGAGFIDRCLAVGAGDCDVVNGLVVEVLQSAGMPARLVVGFVGRNGSVQTSLHAWAEVQIAGRWTAVDATELAPGGAPVASGVAAGEMSAGRQGSSAPFPARSAGVSWTLVSWLAVAAGFCLAALAVWRQLSGTRRQLHLAPEVDAAAWVEGALENPEEFHGLEEVWVRPLVPLVDGRISLRRARELAASGKLWSATRPGELVRAAVAAGRAVVDCSERAGRSAASAFGAVDLDLWEQWLSRRTHEPLLEELTALTRGRWQLAVASSVAHSPQVMSEPVGRGRWRGRWLLWSADDPVLARARTLAAKGRRHHARLLLLESAAGRCAPEEWRSALADGALAALRERLEAGAP